MGPWWLLDKILRYYFREILPFDNPDFEPLPLVMGPSDFATSRLSPLLGWERQPPNLH